MSEPYTPVERATLALLAAITPSRAKCAPRLKREARSALIGAWRRGEVTLDDVMALQALAINGLDIKGSK